MSTRCTAVMMMCVQAVCLLIVAITVDAYSPYPQAGNDIPWPSDRQWCARRPVEQCCPGRDDACTMPILDTLCYCDMFCNRTISDCCPDFWGHCMGIQPPPGALTPPPPPPQIDVINNCIHMGVTHQLGDMMESNCNNCTCVSVPGMNMKKEWNWKCTQHLCVIRPEFIDYINSDNKGWRAGNYSFLWGMTLEEGVIYRLGTFRPMEPVRDMTSLKVQTNDILPAQFDSRSEWPGLVHDVYDQGNCGSSWAFSTTSVAADRLSIHSNGYLKEMLSPQHLISCSYDTKQKGCEGGHLDRAWWFMRSRGVVSEECYPYTSGATNNAGQCKLRTGLAFSSKPRCVGGSGREATRIYQASPPYRIARNEREIMKEIMVNGPVQATMEVKEDFFMYTGGVYKYSMPADYMFPNHRKTGFHSVRILGWGSEYIGGRAINYWLCANSWGTQWGENGLFRIERGSDECKIESFVLGVWGKVDGRQIISRGARGREFNTLYPQGDEAMHKRQQKRHRKKHVKKSNKRDEQTKERGSGKDAQDIDNITTDDIWRQRVKEEMNLLEMINKAYEKEISEHKEEIETLSNEEEDFMKLVKRQGHHEKKRQGHHEKKKQHKSRKDDNEKYYTDLSDIIDKHFNVDK